MGLHRWKSIPRNLLRLLQPLCQHALCDLAAQSWTKVPSIQAQLGSLVRSNPRSTSYNYTTILITVAHLVSDMALRLFCNCLLASQSWSAFRCCSVSRPLALCPSTPAARRRREKPRYHHAGASAHECCTRRCCLTAAVHCRCCAVCR